LKRYKVEFAASAQQDIVRSYIWGCRKWGKQRAQQWARELRNVSKQQLSLFPQGFPLAPENSESAGEIRQVIVGRYRVLFTVRGKKVYVLHVRGAYVEGNKADSKA